MDDHRYFLKCFQCGLQIGLLLACPFVAERGHRKLLYGVVLTFVSLITVWLVFLLH